MSNILFTVQGATFSYKKDNEDEVIIPRASVLITFNAAAAQVFMTVLGNRTYAFYLADNITVDTATDPPVLLTGDGNARLAALKSSVFFVEGVASGNNPGDGGTSAPLDATPTQGSQNGVKSGGVYDALQNVTVDTSNLAKLNQLNQFSAAQIIVSPTGGGVVILQENYGHEGIPSDELYKVSLGFNGNGDPSLSMFTPQVVVGDGQSANSGQGRILERWEADRMVVLGDIGNFGTGNDFGVRIFANGQNALEIDKAGKVKVIDLSAGGKVISTNGVLSVVPDVATPGPKGDPGIQGPKGDPGIQGATGEATDLKDYYKSQNVATYAAALAAATGVYKKIITVANDENSGDTNVKYFYDGVPGSLSEYGDFLSDAYFLKTNAKVGIKPASIGLPELSTAVTSKLSKVDNYFKAIQAMGSPLKAASVGLSWQMATSHTALIDGEIIGNAIYVAEDMSITGIAFRIVTAAAGVTYDNVNGVAFWSQSNGVITRVATSANSGTIYNTAGWVMVPFTAPFAATEGVYFATLLYNNSAQTTAPVIGQVSTGSVDTIYKPLLANGAKLFFKVSAQASYPATITLSGTSNTNITPYLAIYQ